MTPATLATSGTDARVYWHRDLPPLLAVVEDEHVVEAESSPVRARFGDRDSAWDRCSTELRHIAEQRILKELDRRGGWCARVCDEDIHSRVNDAAGTVRLVGRFTYVQYNQPPGKTSVSDADRGRQAACKGA
jgi:hypothetical protein